MNKKTILVLFVVLFTLVFLSSSVLGCDEGCTPGYWKQPQHMDSWLLCVDYEPGDDFAETFGVEAYTSLDVTLLEALKLGGGGEKALARHAVAALLNGCVGLDFDSSDETIEDVYDAFKEGYIEEQKTILDTKNNLGCPLN